MTEPFRLGGVPGVTPAKWLRVWAERLPTVPLELVQLSEESAAEALLSGDVDAALLRLRGDQQLPEGLHHVGLYEELAVAVAGAGHPIVAFDQVTLADLAGEVLDAEGMTDAELLAVAVSGAGVAVVPMSIARELAGPDARHRVIKDAPTTRVFLAWNRKADSELHQELVGIVRGRSARSSRGMDRAETRREDKTENGKRAAGAKPGAGRKPGPAKSGSKRPGRRPGPKRPGGGKPGRRK